MPKDPSTIDGKSTVSIRNFWKDLTWNEIHLAFLGFYAGFVAIRPKPRHEPKKTLKKNLLWKYNSWYWKMCYVGGYILKVIVLVIMGKELGFAASILTV